MARVKAPAHTLANYRPACSCPSLMKVRTILSTDRYPERNAAQLLLVRLLMLAEATVTQTSMLSIRMDCAGQSDGELATFDGFCGPPVRESRKCARCHVLKERTSGDAYACHSKGELLRVCL